MVLLFVPAVVPSTHEPRAAMPLAFVTTVVPLGEEIAPPPVATANTTLTPATGLVPSVTSTDGAVATAAPTAAVWLSPPATLLSVVAVPAVPVAVKVTGLPVRPATAAVNVFAPALPPDRKS